MTKSTGSPAASTSSSSVKAARQQLVGGKHRVRRSTQGVAAAATRSAQQQGRTPAWQSWSPALNSALDATRKSLRAAREAKGLSQTTAAELFVDTIPPDGYGWGMAGNSVSRLERERPHLGRFSIRGLLTWLRVYGVSLVAWAEDVQARMEAEGYSFGGAPTRRQGLESQLVQHFRALPDETQPLAVATLRAMAEQEALRMDAGVAAQRANRQVDSWYQGVLADAARQLEAPPAHGKTRAAR